MNGSEKPTSAARDGSTPIYARSHAPALRHSTTAGGLGCPTRRTSTPRRAASARELYSHSPRPSPPYLTGCRILDVPREEQREANFAGAHEIGDPRIGRLLGLGGRHSRQQS